MNDDELKSFLDEMFPHGVTGEDVLAEIAPEGWENSPLLSCFHPTPEQIFHEQLQIHRNIESLARIRTKRNRGKCKTPPLPEPTLEAVRASWEDRAVKVEDEVRELVGLCLWDVFSDNHDVIAADGRVVDLGSFRGSAGFIADYLSGRHATNDNFEDSSTMDWDYCRFYMGTIWIAQRADLSPVYRLIFRRLRSRGAEWIYRFPQIGVVDLSHLQGRENKPMEEYSPSEASAEEQAEGERREKWAKMQAELEEGNAQMRQDALDRPPPATVLAYEQVYGREPEGWPPD